LSGLDAPNILIRTHHSGRGPEPAAAPTSKNDPNDALSAAVAALCSATRRVVAAEDHAAVLKVWSKRHRDLGRARTQVACRSMSSFTGARMHRQPS
jgi:hypothetical protein